MLCILVGVLISVLLSKFSRRYKEDSFLAGIMVAFSMVFFATGIVVGIILPTSYEKPILTEEYELVSLDNDLMYDVKGNIFYLSVSADNVYTFRYRVNNEYDLDGKSYKVSTLKRNVIEIESEDCDRPALKVYKIKPKVTAISVGLGTSKTEYVFYVPEGIIQKEIILK